MPPSWGMPPLTTLISMASAQPSQQIPRWYVHPNAQKLLTQWSLLLIGPPLGPNPQVFVTWQAIVPTTTFILGLNL